MPDRCHDHPGRPRGPAAAAPIGCQMRRAFTLLEMVLVMGITVVLAGIAIPRYAQSTRRYQADLGSRRIVADLMLAQSAARATGLSKQVVFDVTSNSYRLAEVQGLDGRSSSYLVNLAQAPYGARLVSACFSGSSTMTFDGWGIPAQSGTIVLSVASESRTVVVDRATATVRIQ